MPNRSLPDSPSRWTSVTRLLGLDSAVSYAVAARIWQIFSSPLTSLLLLFCFSEAARGYYFVFLSLLQLQTFVELGTQWAILYVTSHEWARLNLGVDGRISGEATALARLAGLTRFARNWFAVGAVLFFVFTGGAGWWLISQRGQDIAWQAPWIAVLLLASTGLILSPFISVLEGCDQMATVNRFRFWQAVTGSMVVWASILAGVELWVAVAAVGTQVLWELSLLTRYRQFWQSIPARTAPFPWRTEVWPLQWRLAVQSIFRYFAFGLFSVLTFHYHGDVLAGRVGMTWMVITALQQAAFAWVRTRTPTFGALVTRRDYSQLDRLFLRMTAVSTVMLWFVLAAFCGVLWLLTQGDHDLSRKISGGFLPPPEAIALSLAIWVSHLPQCLGVYLRAHKRDPLLWLTVAANSLIGLLVWQSIARFGLWHAAVSLLAVLSLVTLPGTTWIWLRCRAQWHQA